MFFSALTATTCLKSNLDRANNRGGGGQAMGMPLK